MKKFFLFLSLFPLLLFAQPHAFFDDDDPTIFHHVNVIHGNLSLCCQDTVVEGALPFPLVRAYSSSGALERTKTKFDNQMKSASFDWILRGGWSFLPHTAFFTFRNPKSKGDESLEVYVPEKEATILTYSFKKKEKGYHNFAPSWAPPRLSGSLSSRKNPLKNRLQIPIKKKRAKLFCADGTIRYYKQANHLKRNPFDCWLLQREILPSKQIIEYFYGDDDLTKIQLLNPAGTKVLSFIDFTHKKLNDTLNLTIETSDHKTLVYQTMKFKDQQYLYEVKSNCRPYEFLDYQPGRKGRGARVGGMSLDGKEQFFVTYYSPVDKHAEKAWAKYPTVPLSMDRVKTLEIPTGLLGEKTPIAIFKYYSYHTDVRDAEGILTRYHHYDDYLTKIEYFDKEENLSSTITFLWRNGKLANKYLLDANGTPLLARAFRYDDQGNIQKEIFRGELTGNYPVPLYLTKKLWPQGGETYTKYYKYENRLPIEETDRETTYYYQYFKNTDLPSAKFTATKGTIFLREFSFYNEDHILIKEVLDDGSTQDPHNLQGVTERHIIHYEIDPQTCLRLSSIETYLDLETNQEQLLKKITYTYSDRNQVITETIFDANNQQRYTLHTEYDPYGRITRKTTPTGRTNTYTYDSSGNLIESKEVGQSKKSYIYDAANLPIQLTENDEKITQNNFDVKGRLIEKIDSKGNLTKQVYDSFGNCIETHYPQTLDEFQSPYTPAIHFQYDCQGNLISYTKPKNETTHTHYNAFKKPLRIDYPDQTAITYRYSITGNHTQTYHPDGTYEQYAYDCLGRKTSKIIYSPHQAILSSETWTYDSFHLRSYTNPEGLITTYTYDSAGRKTQETSLDRTLHYTYDPLGYLSTLTQNGHTKVYIYDEEGAIIQQWEEDKQIENHITFTYNTEGRKAKATRLTSCGEAIDTFEYDSEGQLILHTDPEFNSTTYQLNETHLNNLGQYVLAKTTTDPLGNHTIEVYDTLNHLVEIKKQSPQKQTVSHEHFLYDRAGNQAEHISTIYNENIPIKTFSIKWKHDPRGRITKETEANQKMTTYTYDPKGRLTSKTLPSRATVSYTYDDLDRLTHLRSSDLHYEYTYAKGPDPIAAHDHMHNLYWQRQYNLFGELTSETRPDNTTLTWDYDTSGRCLCFTLPDHSSITYTYTPLHLNTVTRTSPSNAYTHHYSSFDENGHVQSEQHINNHGTTTTKRDLLERPISQQTPYNTLKLTYNAASLISHSENTLFPSKTYAYDPLHQLIQEGSKQYQFDSLGNPANFQTNLLNQITSTTNETLTYDPNGNPLLRQSSSTTHYTYDTLNRLTSIQHPDQHIHYTYDPFNRLYSKQTDTTQYFLYDQDKEIGLIDQNTIIQLKVLGLGIQSDIGAAIAIELDSTPYLPLHDLSGNIIALIAPNKKIEETYELSAFGPEALAPSLNPWRFNSKRTEDHLIFFGLRFYDPILGRWLTPDPAGTIDSANLYLYVRNSPQNRLDLFGLLSEDEYLRYDLGHYHNVTPPPGYFNTPSISQYFDQCKYIKGDIQLDVIISSSLIHKIQFTPEEHSAGQANIFDHFTEMFPKKGSCIGLITAQNGINNKLEGLTEISHSIMSKVPENTGFMGILNATHGIVPDAVRTFTEVAKIDTPIVCATRQLLSAIAESLHNVNSDLLWLHVSHSESSAIYVRAYEGMTDDQKGLMQRHLLAFGIAPALPIPRGYTNDAKNIYSDLDGITGLSGLIHYSMPNYNIKFIESQSNFYRATLLHFDHGFLGKTYQFGLGRYIRSQRDEHGFYENNNR